MAVTSGPLTRAFLILALVALLGPGCEVKIREPGPEQAASPAPVAAPAPTAPPSTPAPRKPVTSAIAAKPRPPSEQVAHADWGPLYPVTPEEDAFLDDMEHRMFNYFWNEIYAESGIAIDHTDNRIGKVAATGFELAAVCIGVKRGWISYDEGYTRAFKILDFFWNNPADATDRFVEGQFGLYWHFVDGETGVKKPIDCVAVCDSADFIAGVIVAGQFFRGTPIQQLAQRIYDEVEWDRFVSDDPAGGPGLMSYGWVPLNVSESYFNVDGLLPFNMKGFDDNSMLIYAMALGSDTHPIPNKTWRLYVDSYNIGEYEGFRCVEAGQIFCRQVPQSFIRMSRKRDRKIDYFEDTVFAYLADRAFNMKVNGYPPEVWGLNDCFGKETYTHSAPPGPINNDGTVSSAGFVGAIPHIPRLSLDAMKFIKDKFGDRMWAEYGFTSSLNLKNDFISPLYVGIELGPMIMMVENFRSGLIWNLFMKHRSMKNFVKRADMCGVVDDFELPPEAPPYARWTVDPGEATIGKVRPQRGQFALTIASTSAHVRVAGQLSRNDLLQFHFHKFLSLWTRDLRVASVEAQIDGTPVPLLLAGKLDGATWAHLYFTMPALAATSVLTAVAFEADITGNAPALDNIVLEESADLEAPPQIGDLTASPGRIGTSIQLQWTIPDGGGLDRVSTFVLVSGTSPLQPGAVGSVAERIEIGANGKAGDKHPFTLLTDGKKKRYLSVAAVDEHGHRGPFSAQVECAPNPDPLDLNAYDFENQSLAGWRASSASWNLRVRQFRNAGKATRALEVNFTKEGAWDHLLVDLDPVMVANHRYITMKVAGKVELLGKLWINDQVQSDMERQASTSDTGSTVLRFDTWKAGLSPGDRIRVEKMLLFPEPGKDGAKGLFLVDSVDYAN